MPTSNTPSARRGRRNTLKAACLSAGLATAFGSAPAQAVTPSPGLQSTNGSQSTPIYDGYLLNASPSAFPSAVTEAPSVTPVDPYTPDTVTPVPASSSAPTGANSVVVFTAAAEAANLSGESFENAFLVPTADIFYPDEDYTEAEVANYIASGTASGFTDTSTTDQNAYDDFLGNLYDTYYGSPNQTGTISAYAFTNGQYAGTVNSSQLPAGNAPNTGFGLATPQAAAVPEPGSLPLLMAGGLVLAGMTVKRRRRSL